MTRETRHSTISRRTMLQALGVAAVGAPLTVFAQGRCIRSYGTPDCNTDPIPPVFAPTGWKTAGLDHLTFDVANYRKEAAFYMALMGWTLRSDNGREAVLDIGDWASVILREAPLSVFPTTGGFGGRAPAKAIVRTFCFVIEPWDAKEVAAELRTRGLTPVADNGPGGFESFHVKDPDGFDLQISNGNGLAKARRTAPAHATWNVPAPFASTGWRTVWLDHLSFGVSNYKRSASFYCNLLGWKPTYDEGSQNECLMGEVGDIIIRGGNVLSHAFGRPGPQGRIDHISFGIQPWDTDKVKAALEARHLPARVDTSTGDEIHVAAFQSYHTFTPNGYNLQVSHTTHDTRLTLSNAVRPKPTK
ncbi:MAG: VOC family protein [Acidobacteriota bacterium]|nr:VOC family protein [Acidobacteriota bacterium]